MAGSASGPSFTAAVRPRDATPETPCQVGDLGRDLRDYIARLGSVWVEGEITEWNHRAVGTFATLRDLAGDSVIRLTIWSSVRNRIPQNIAAGDRVIVSVKPEYRAQRGEISFIVSAVKQVGLGDLLERLERLREQLRSEGLIDPSRKKRLPFLPTTIGLITGKATDAEKDVLRNAELRWPHVEFRVEHAAVQGEQSVAQLLTALATLEADPTVDVIIFARGGGDFQDLLGFSDERLLRAVAAAHTPIVSAIGHENDRPLLDDVADLRASTPTDAAKRVVPDVSEQLALVRDARSRIMTRLAGRLQHEQLTIEQLRSRPVLAHPHRWLENRELALEQSISVIRAELAVTLEKETTRVSRLHASLGSLSPLRTLDRGYAIVHDPQNGIVRSAEQAPAGTELQIMLASGSVSAQSHGAVPE